MIKSNDLRIGNLVLFDGKIQEIGALSKEYPFLSDEYGVGVVTYDNIEGIVLTPEILEKCGFSKRINDGVVVEYFLGTNPVTHDWMIYLKWLKGREYPFYRNWYHVIKYLHQLQNLYFALTGEELNYNP